MADESKFGQERGHTPGGGLRCEEWEALLTDALDGLLPAGETSRFNAHSETCANCGDLLAHAKQGQQWLEYLHEEPEIPSGLIGKILEQTVGAGGVPLPVVAAAGAGAGTAAIAMPWRRSFHETRLLMTVAMAFFSIALTLNLVGVKFGSLRLADLKPAQLSSTLSREFYGARKSVVQYYDNVRLFYQLQSRMRELRRDVETQPQQQNQKQNQQQQKKGGSAIAVPERGDVLNAQGQGTGYSVQRTEERAAYSVQGAVERTACSVQGAEKQKAAVVLVSAGTGKTISLGHKRTGLRKVNVEGSLV